MTVPDRGRTCGNETFGHTATQAKKRCDATGGKGSLRRVRRKAGRTKISDVSVADQN